MSNSFVIASKIEQQASPVVINYFKLQGYEIQQIIWRADRPEWQIVFGDFIITTPKAAQFCIEMKVESKTTGNLFLEIWSNLHLFRRGWLDHSQADKIIYGFIDSWKFYFMNLKALKEWSFTDGNLKKYPLVLQKKYTQANETWGHIVPINILKKELGENIKEVDLSTYRLKSNFQENLYEQ